MNPNVTLGMAALEYAANGGQSNVSPEMAKAILQELADLRGLCAWAADDLPGILILLAEGERRDWVELLKSLREAAMRGETAKDRRSPPPCEADTVPLVASVEVRGRMCYVVPRHTGDLRMVVIPFATDDEARACAVVLSNARVAKVGAK
jgi:hypothetical protein